MEESLPREAGHLFQFQGNPVARVHAILRQDTHLCSDLSVKALPEGGRAAGRQHTTRSHVSMALCEHGLRVRQLSPGSRASYYILTSL